MGTFKTAWLIGSYASLPAQAFVINASPQSVAAGSYYLHSATGALSLLEQVKAAMTAAGLVNPVAVLCQNRKVRLSADVAFGMTWGTGTLLRDLLGFDGLGLAVAADHVATLVSPLLWSPARQESSLLTPLGVRGHIEYLSRQSVSPYSGRTETIAHGQREFQTFRFPHVLTERVTTAAGEGGTFARWFSDVAVRGARFHLWRNVTENTASTTAATLSTSLGAYIYTATGKGVMWKFDRSKGLERAEVVADLDIPCHVCGEYTS